MKLIGILLVLNSLGLAAWWISTNGSHKATVVALCLVAVFAGVTLILQDRITEFTVQGVGTIKAATQQVESDAQLVSELKNRVESQSATVDLVAQEASNAKALSEEVANKNQQAEKKLTILNEAIKKANETLTDLNLTSEFTLTVSAAQNDDRKAFDKLKEWSEDKNNPFSSKAAQAWNTIFESHNDSMYNSNFTIPWTEAVDPSKFLLPKLIQQYNGAPVQLRPALLEYIWKREDIPKIDRLDFMIEIMKQDSSLTAVEYAGRHFTAGTKLKIKPSAVEYLVSWWNEHRQEYIGK
jgi:apolipoprotein N-acyltransferase